MQLALVVSPYTRPLHGHELPVADGNVLLLARSSGLGRFVERTLIGEDWSLAQTVVLHLQAHVVAETSPEDTVATQVWLEGASSHARLQTEGHLRAAFELRDRGDLEGAEQHYRCVLERLGESAAAAEDGTTSPYQSEGRTTDRRTDQERAAHQVLALVTLAEIVAARGRVQEGIGYLDRALAIAPTHIGALRARAAMAKQTGEHALSAAMLYRLVRSEQDADRRFDVLLSAAEDSLRAARDALLEASALRPHDIGLLSRLRSTHEICNAWDEAVGVLVRIAEATPDPRARARVLAEAARRCSEWTGNVRRAVALYEAAIEDDPTVPGAFEAIEAELLRYEDFAGVAAAYERQLARLPSDATAQDRVRLWAKLADVQAHKLRDPEGAARSLRRILEIQPDHTAARVALSELLVLANRHAEAIESLERAVVLSPADAALYRRMHGLFLATKDEDRTYAACAALVALGEADLDEQLTYAQYSPTGMLAPSRTLDAEAWALLIPEGHHLALDALMRIIEPAVVEIWRSEHPAAAQQRPSESTRQDPTKSTASAVRCVAWASRFLGVPVPRIYAEPSNHRVSIASLPCHDHGVVLGRHVLSGRAVPELAFITAHHAAYARPGCRVLLLYPDVRELQALCRAAITMVRPNLPAAADLDERARALRTKLEGTIDPSRRQELAVAVEAVLRSELPVDLRSWGLGIEQLACRAGLLACGDVAVAIPALSVCPGFGGSAKDRATGLLPFSVSEPYARLRTGLGVAAPNSAPCAPPSRVSSLPAPPSSQPPG